MIIFHGGYVTKMEFPEGKGGPFCELILENPEWRGVPDTGIYKQHCTPTE